MSKLGWERVSQKGNFGLINENKQVSKTIRNLNHMVAGVDTRGDYGS